MNSKETITIREIQPGDNKAVADMIRAVFEEHRAPREGTVYSDPATDDLYSLFRQARSVCWVATYGNRVTGCCGIYPTPGLPGHCAELVKFYLSKEARGRGTGKALMEKSIESARNMGYTELYIESMPAFSNAVRIYEKIGFEMLDHPLGASGHTSCNIWMLKKLM
ncbi:MAG: GNAT family N-acetyltransferase [Chitinophagaceae bacterium]|nr:GNAT family N-acetyltransferase [Chitinophagaceae bacterium]MCW5928004.1 GNAT family N-acetyltransferase [Chitinophagaceae bacterium]